MTAEVAILNKSAVALAADSAVTISAGSDQQKIFDSADKLFELSCADAIGVMVNGDMNFMQAPLGVLVKRYRSTCPRFKNVADAAEDFIDYLAKFGPSAPNGVKQAALVAAVKPIYDTIQKRTVEAFPNRLISSSEEDDETFEDRIRRIQREIMSEQVAVMKMALSRLDDASFTGDGEYEPSAADVIGVDTAIVAIFGEEVDGEQMAEMRDVGVLALRKQRTSPSYTGLIVAGYGGEELFPTLISMELYGVVGDRLKYSTRDMVDVDREGTRAKVLPFAQREMVERFLYGLDDSIKRNISNFCKAAVPKIREKLFEQLDMSDEDIDVLTREAEQAEAAFYAGLIDESFDAIRTESQAAIEDMVEFMPKPEMARMAEALVNLTSIKRRVSRGMETVGGPIDVAVISQAEGFVWVKRKHYFPSELNARFFDRRRS